MPPSADGDGLGSGVGSTVAVGVGTTAGPPTSETGERNS
jgi:hypothetical protein